MKIKGEVTTTRNIIIKTMCDICKKEVTTGYGGNDWHRFNETTIEAKIGDRYPDCDCRTKYEIDICKDCFVDKLIPLLEKEFDLKFKEEDCE